MPSRHTADMIYYLQQATRHAILLEHHMAMRNEGGAVERLDMLLADIGKASEAMKKFADEIKREHEAHEQN
jgi:hypothetical protein